MGTSSALKSIFAYTDFRRYLRDYYEWRKSSGAFSYRAFSEIAGVCSPNFLKLVIDGSKNLTIENIHRFARACELRSHEHEFFESLVLYCQSDSAADRSYYRSRMNQYSQHQSHEKVAGDSVVLGDWYYPAVLVTIENQSVDCDLALLARKCGVSIDEYRECLSRLIAARLVSSVNGNYHLSAKFLNLENRKATSAKHKRYLEKQLALSTQIFRSAYERNAKFLSHTFTLDLSSFSIFHDRMHALLDEIDHASDSQGGEHVAQLNMQLFMLEERGRSAAGHGS